MPEFQIYFNVLWAFCLLCLIAYKETSDDFLPCFTFLRQPNKKESFVLRSLRCLGEWQKSVEVCTRSANNLLGKMLENHAQWLDDLQENVKSAHLLGYISREGLPFFKNSLCHNVVKDRGESPGECMKAASVPSGISLSMKYDNPLKDHLKNKSTSRITPKQLRMADEINANDITHNHKIIVSLSCF
ncbi:hypothetical protein T11_12819 [Trichinella zimbabwensis]|uniref:Uncharacterized protein n=1 Tax=Trichinella zimbabwensis TaxID=268475 RepID=A0A0V1GRN7_9BILA|nr:hypothetical protein T11_11349 [Trichinella zimbabwensis]KRZ00869.1 hypothetical protein T11_12819 [Trichinella zimbabwensis]